MNRILLIEDDPGAQLLYRNRLTELGYEVVVSSTGAMGLLEARSVPFDLFLVDIGLGSGIDGYEVCRRLKTIPEIHAVPVVLISGAVKGQEHLHKGYEAGCQSFLVKGDMTLLEDVVRAMLRTKTLQDDLALQNRLLDGHNRRLGAERVRQAEPTDGRSVRARPAPPHPEGMLLVDGEGIVCSSDRGARELFGKSIEGQHLARLAPASRLEAIVRNTRTEPNEANRVEVPERPGRPARHLLVSVYPFMPRVDSDEALLRAVVFFDAAHRSHDDGRNDESRAGWSALVEVAREVYRPSALLGTSALMRALRAVVARTATADESVVISGPSGSGKSFLARVLHYTSMRSGPFVELSCAAFAAHQLELAIFGGDRGALAAPEAHGALQRARGGTLHLQDVDRLSPELHERLLEVFSRRAVRESQPALDLRLIASVRTGPGTRAGQERLPAELAQRLGALALAVTGLRQRTEDIAVLARHFLAQYGLGQHAQQTEPYFSAEALALLAQHDWPGNVRELEGVVQGACAAARKSAIEPTDLPQPFPDLLARQGRARRISSGASANGVVLDKEVADALADVDSAVSLLDAYEKGALLHALRVKNGDKLGAAKLLRVGKSTFYRKLKQHGIT